MDVACTYFLFHKIGFSRAKELEYIRLLNKHGVGVPLVAWFSNGIVSKLVPGRDLNNEELIDILTDEAFARFEAPTTKLKIMYYEDIRFDS